MKVEAYLNRKKTKSVILDSDKNPIKFIFVALYVRIFLDLPDKIIHKNVS